jgi:[lysine-biosynthesis-protein LysW]---L-2-aminoadipate ligase
VIKLIILHSTIRKEEKLIQEAARGRGIQTCLIDIRRTILAPGSPSLECDVVLERSLSTVKGFYAAAAFESRGIPVVNPLSTARICSDKYLTSLRLHEAGVPGPGFAMAFDSKQALTAVDMLGGFPVVVKPAQGSWGRLLARINDRDALEAVLEHKQVLGTPPQKAFYIQEYIQKPGYDLRVFMAGEEVMCAIARESGHWITNTALGARARNHPVSDELREICRNASRAVGGGLLAVDLFEMESGLLVNEVNHTMEFRNSEEPTGVSISGAIVDHCVRAARGESR